MGFSSAEATQAYLVCNKNTEMAADMLLSAGMDEEDDSDYLM